MQTRQSAHEKRGPTKVEMGKNGPTKHKMKATDP